MLGDRYSMLSRGCWPDFLKYQSYFSTNEGLFCRFELAYTLILSANDNAREGIPISLLFTGLTSKNKLSFGLVVIIRRTKYLLRYICELSESQQCRNF